MSINSKLTKLTTDEVAALRPRLKYLGMGEWESPDGDIFDGEDIQWIDGELAAAYLSEKVVLAVNSHASLLAACQAIAEHSNPDGGQNYRADDPQGCLDRVYELARAAIQQAGGTK